MGQNRRARDILDKIVGEKTIVDRLVDLYNANMINSDDVIAIIGSKLFKKIRKR